jgi:transposase
MARPRRINQQLVQRARETVRQTKDCMEMRQALAVLLPAEMDCTLEQTACLLGVGRATVPRLQAGFQKREQKNPPVAVQWGGRRRAFMSSSEEEAFLKPWEEQAKSGQVLVLSPIRAALAQHLGRPVAASVVYRFLARHGWRKVAPDTRHPKSDPQVQEDWKKNFRKCWHPC